MCIDADNLRGLTELIARADLIVLAGHPSVGKTTLASKIVEDFALGTPNQDPCPVAVFSLETKGESLMRRMFLHSARVAFHELVSGKISAAEFGKIKEVATAFQCAPIYIEDAVFDIMEIHARARELTREFGIKFIVLDYLELVSYAKHIKNGCQSTRMAVSHALIRMAKELKVPILVLSQLCSVPPAMNNILKLTGLCDPNWIEQDVDIVMMLHRPRLDEKDRVAGVKSPAIVDILKNLHGPLGKWRLHLDYGVL